MIKKNSLRKWVLIICLLFFFVEAVIPFTIRFISRINSARNVSVYECITVSDVSCTKIDGDYPDYYTAREGYTLYEVRSSMTNAASQDYMVMDHFDYHADGTVTIGFKGESYLETTDVYEMEECSVVYSNCSGYNETFGYDAVTVIPSGCTVIRRDIIEVPDHASHIALYCSYTGDYVIDL